MIRVVVIVMVRVKVKVRVGHHHGHAMSPEGVSYRAELRAGANCRV